MSRKTLDVATSAREAFGGGLNGVNSDDDMSRRRWLQRRISSPLFPVPPPPFRIRFSDDGDDAMLSRAASTAALRPRIRKKARENKREAEEKKKERKKQNCFFFALVSSFLSLAHTFHFFLFLPFFPTSRAGEGQGACKLAVTSPLSADKKTT